jgi:uncharacterized protein with NRDE domain
MQLQVQDSRQSSINSSCATAAAAALQGLPHQDYYGFNLLVGDLQQQQQLAYTSNRGPTEPQMLPAGCYGRQSNIASQQAGCLWQHKPLA